MSFRSVRTISGSGGTPPKAKTGDRTTGEKVANKAENILIRTNMFEISVYHIDKALLDSSTISAFCRARFSGLTVRILQVRKRNYT